MKRFILTIFGDVQGVGFRYFAMRKAKELGVRGWIQNRDDGSVYVEAEGENAALDAFIAWCRKGPFFARVERVEIAEVPLKHFQDFIIAR